MNKIKNLFPVLCYIVLFTACTKKTDSLFDKTADERLSEALTNYQNALTGAPGWKLFVYPKGLETQNIKLGGYTYYLKFTNTNRVSMVSDFITDIASTPKESGYHLKALQRPSLIFDTYTYMHIPADPDPAVSYSPTKTGGYGLGTDFNFSFTTTAIKDTFQLIGNFNNSEAVLVKATQDEMDAAFARSRLKDIMNFSFAYPTTNPFLYILASPTLKVGVGFDFNKKFLTFSYLEGSVLVNKSYPFSFTTKGIYFKTPITIGNYTFQEAFWDDVKKIYYITSGTTRVEFANSATPLIITSLTNVIGNQYTTITVPITPLPNQSPLFITRYNLVKSGILNGPYVLNLGDMDFVFNAALKTMTLNVHVSQFGTPFIAQYYYTFSVDASGNYKFTRSPTGQNGNGAAIATNMNNILVFIDNDLFKIDGFSTSLSFLGQFTSIQNPTFYFTGNLY